MLGCGWLAAGATGLLAGDHALATEVALGAVSILSGVSGAAVLRTRRRVRELALIATALEAVSAGEADAGALRVAERLGPLAGAWNGLVEQSRQPAQQERRRAVEAAALGRFGAGHSGLAEALDAIWHGVLLLDETGRVDFGNGAAAALLETPREQLVGADPGELFGDPRVSAAVARVLRLGMGREVVELERQAPAAPGGEEPGGTRRAGDASSESGGNGANGANAGPGAPRAVRAAAAGGGAGVFRLTVRRVRHTDRAAAIAVIEDVTQQRAAERARQSFVAQATHELRTPLTNIRLLVEEAIEEGQRDAALVQRALNTINSESRRLERVVGEMLSASEIESGSMRLRVGSVRLEQVFEDLQADFGPQAKEKSIEFSLDLPPKWPVAAADRDKLTLCLHNLVGNAVKYTPRGGSVRVRVEAEDGLLRVDVVDSGIGIAPEEQARVFERFYRANDPRLSGITGSGLGLALAREVARLHGGDVSVVSELNKGSTFTLTVPLGEARRAAA